MPYRHSFDALGTRFLITVWDEVSAADFSLVASAAESLVRKFDASYSRFIPDSLISRLAQQTGTYEVPADLVVMLRLYEKVHLATHGKINPCIGNALSDTGYDAQYSLLEKKIRPTPRMPDAIVIVDDYHIQLRAPVLLDLGALGKGYVIDKVYDLLCTRGYTHFLVDGSGDIRYKSSGQPITCGLEHPLDPKMAIGTLVITEGSVCASAVNRRAWGSGRNHYIDPDTGTSPTEIIATWVYAENAALADAIASALFFSQASELHDFSFEYLVLSKELKPKSSAGFAAELFHEHS